MWLLDLGNTRLKLARVDADAAVLDIGATAVTALAHAEAEFDARLVRALSSATSGDTAWLASVAPDSVRQRVEAVLDALGLRVRPARTQSACAGLRIAYADPARLGVDRFLALLAARRRGGDWLLASFGSALTVDLLDAEGRHRGGLIGIAPAHQVDALRTRFPALDRGEGDAATRWAADTPDAVAAGARRQALGLLLAAFDDARAELGRAPRVLLGGGDAGSFADELSRRLGIEVETHDALVLEGLAVYASALDG